MPAEAQQALIERLQAQWSMPDAGGHSDCRPMTWAQLREMREGGMEIGSHGVDPVSYTQLGGDTGQLLR